MNRTQEETYKQPTGAPDAILPGDKYALTINEASAYFSIGAKKLRRLAAENLGRFALQNGAHLLIIRTKFEKFLDNSSTV